MLRTASPLLPLPLLLALLGCPGAGPAGQPAANPLAKDADPWVGEASGDGLTLSLERADAGYTGALTLDGQTFPLTAALEGERLEGTFRSGEAAFPFVVTLADGGRRVLESGGTRYTLTPEAPPAPENPLARAAPAPAAPTPVAPAAQSQPPAPGRPEERPVSPAASTADWPSWRHAIGVAFRYPPGWTAKESEGVVLLTPPDQALQDGQPLEAFFLVGVPAEGVSDPSDPRAVQFVAAQIGRMFPHLAQAGEPERLTLGDPVAAHTFEGTSPAGVKVRARVYLKILRDTGLLAVAVGEVGRIAARDPVVQQLVSTFSMGEQQLQPRLVGAWRAERHYSSGDFGSTSVTYLTLRADGGCLMSSRLLASSTHTDMGGNPTGSTAVDSGEGDADHGRWSADEKTLWMRWDDGSVGEFSYECTGSNLMLTPSGGGKPRLYDRAQ